ncbi:hypothetical protein [Rhizobium sp. GN54]|uniref:hypothetical protein n=1 Tax=Rhizobium sp. GN54 TaxID=2898150 RepID=UPI001E5A778E|nr:hypothetical protein [Rhizobium sp. GN54]MCD2182303.1 hypothetical protein [Rhizobium sp. GN54]
MSAFGARRDKGAPIDLLPPEPGKRRREAAVRRPSPEIVDADFVVLPDRGKAARAPAKNDNRLQEGADGAAVAIMVAIGRFALAAVVASAQLVERGLQRLPARAFGTVVTAGVAGAFFFAGGLSALATVFSGGGAEAGLKVAGVASSLDDRDGMKVLSVYGAVENRSLKAHPLPAIIVDVIVGGRTVARHRIETASARMAPGATRPFSLKIPHKGTSLPKVAVSLVPEDALRR